MTDERTEQELVSAAIQARKNAYAPYSRFTVGAAVLTEDKRIYGGCNVENASFGAGICAERTAISSAVSNGAGRILALAVTGGPADCTGEVPEDTMPCGICRQTLREFAEPESCDIIIVKSLNNYRTTTLARLLPESFGPEMIPKKTNPV